METKTGYDKMQSGYNHNTMDYSPNAGEGHMFYSDGEYGSVGDSSGVADGLSSVETMDIKGTQVAQDQRVMSQRESAGGNFEIGC